MCCCAVLPVETVELVLSACSLHVYLCAVCTAVHCGRAATPAAWPVCTEPSVYTVLFGTAVLAQQLQLVLCLKHQSKLACAAGAAAAAAVGGAHRQQRHCFACCL